MDSIFPASTQLDPSPRSLKGTLLGDRTHPSPPDSPLQLRSSSAATRLVFIDSAVENAQALVDGVLKGAEVVLLNADQDGIEQITQAIAGRTNIASLDIVSYGSPGRLQLGSSGLDFNSLSRYSSQVQQWGQSLTADADMLLYGCNVAATSEGISFVQRLSQLTGADVAASSDVTGSAARGGDWDLEVAIGTIEAPLVFRPEVLAAYSGAFDGGTGLKAEYFDNIDFTNLKLTRTDATVNFNWGNGSPNAAIGADTFSARWTGQVQAKYSESYTFYTTSDDGIRLWVNGQQIINQWVDQASKEVSGKITLVAGQKYDIRLEYFENTGGAVAKLSWASASQAKQVIPQAQLFNTQGLTTIEFAQSSFNVNENGGTATVTLRRNGNTSAASSVQVSTSNGTALASSDYTATSGIVTFAIGEASKTFTVPILNDTVSEPSETINLTLSNVSGAALATQTTATITIADDDASAGTGTGLSGEYFDNIDLTNLKLTRTDATVNFDWGAGSPDASIGIDTFSARWTGQVQAKYSETYTFYTSSDDGARLWVNGQQIINQWVNQGNTEVAGSITLVAGQKYDIRLEYFENGGEAVSQLSWSSVSQVKQIIPQSQLYAAIVAPPPPPTPVGTGNGLTGEYFDNIDLTAPKLTRTDATVNFNWGAGSPDASIGIDTFSARWTGQVQAQYSETYTFYTTSDDGARLWVNGQQVINRWVDQDSVEAAGTITLVAGQKYDIKLEYYENGGGAVSQLSWSSASQTKQIIPQSQLYAAAQVSTFSLKDNATIFVNEAAGVATVTAVRTGSTQERLTLEYTTNEVGAGSATAGMDYTPPIFGGRANTGQVVFEIGESEKSFTIPIINDTLAESNETFAIGIQNPSGGTLGAPRTVLITIVDNDGSATISVNTATVTVSEGMPVANITVERSGSSTGVATVNFNTSNGTAIAGSDYTATSGTITFAAGQTTQTVSIPILNDTVPESNETFSVTLNTPGGAVLGGQTTATVTILDNDLNLGTLTRQTVVSGLTEPTAIDWTPDGRYILVAQKNGAVRVVDNGVLRSTPLIDLSAQVNDARDRGLLGMTIHPNFPATPYVYLLYTYDPPEAIVGGTGLNGTDQNGNRPSRLVRVTVNPTTMIANPSSLVVLTGTNSTWAYTSRPDGNSTGDLNILPSGIVNGTTINPAPGTVKIDVGVQDNDPDRAGIQNQNIRDYLATDSESHSIGAVHFGPDGYLYLSNGDGTSYNFEDPRAVRVQDIDNLSGKVLRIDPITGQGVAGNPFFEPNDPNSNQSKVFYSGVRNAFRFTFDPVTNLPVIGDVGWSSWEEINTGPAGSNFGWPYLEGVTRTGGYQTLSQAVSFYNNNNVNPGSPSTQPAVFPILSRSHGAPDGASAIVLGDFYNSNTLMFGDLNSGTFYAATLDTNRQVTNVQVFDSGLPMLWIWKWGQMESCMVLP